MIGNEVPQIQPESQSKKSQVVGAETSKTLGHLFPNQNVESLISKHSSDLSFFSFYEPSHNQTRSISVFALPGLAFGHDSFMLQEKPIGKLGCFVSCDYPDGHLYTDLYLAQIKDAIAEQKGKGRKVIVMGDSLGGVFSVLLANQTKNIDGLILISTPIAPEELRAGSFKLLKKIASNSGLSQVTARTMFLFGSSSTSVTSLFIPNEYRERYRKNLLSADPKAVESRVAAFISIIEEMESKPPPRSNIPTLVIQAEKDQILDPQHSRLGELFSNSSTRVIPGSHAAMIKHADSYNETIIEWIKDQFKD